MTAKEYQEKAHSTAVYGNVMAYPIAALAEETGEVLRVYGAYRKDELEGNGNWAETLMKLKDELGDVLWNISELCTVLGLCFEGLISDASRVAFSDNDKVELEASPVDDDLMVQMCELVNRVGALNGTWAKYIRKHNGHVPSIEEVKKTFEQLDDGSNDALAYRFQVDLFFVMFAMLKVLDNCSLNIGEVMDANIFKLARRKANNTLGGEGSVERKE